MHGGRQGGKVAILYLFLSGLMINLYQNFMLGEYPRGQSPIKALHLVPWAFSTMVYGYTQYCISICETHVHDFIWNSNIWQNLSHGYWPCLLELSITFTPTNPFGSNCVLCMSACVCMCVRICVCACVCYYVCVCGYVCEVLNLWPKIRLAAKQTKIKARREKILERARWRGSPLGV